MWQRFTERARRVVFFAQEEAGRLGENYVSTEHLLLGLVRENDSVATRILSSMGISLGRIRSEIERQVSRGDGRIGKDMQLTPRCKRVIDLAYDEARQLSNNYIGTEHLLLGLIREGEGLAGRVLTKLGVELERTRREVMTLQDNDSGLKSSTAPASDPAPIVSQKKRFAQGYQKLTLKKELVWEFGRLTDEQQRQLLAEGIPFGQVPDDFRGTVVELMNAIMHSGYQSSAESSSTYAFDRDAAVSLSIAHLRGAKQYTVMTNVSVLVNFMIPDPLVDPMPVMEQPDAEAMEDNADNESPSEEVPFQNVSTEETFSEETSSKDKSD